jgi:hypothetical protein
MALEPSFIQIVVAHVGSFSVHIFDLLLFAATCTFLYAVSVHPPTDASVGNRTVLRLIGAYVLYQVVVVMPVAAFVHGVHLGDAYSLLYDRIALVLVPFFYYVGLRHMSPRHVIGLMNLAAAALLLYAVYRYVFIGPVGDYEYGVFRLRIVWGGSVLLFGWMVVTGLFLQRRSLLGYVMGVGGILGIALVNQRSGYIALICALVAEFFISLRISWRVVSVVIAVVILGIAMSMASPTFRDSATYSLRTMFNAQADTSAKDRVQRSELAWKYLMTQPFGDYVWAQRYYLVNLRTLNFEPHNFVIQALDEQGWISALLLFAVIGSVLRIGWSLRRKDRIASVMTTYLVFYLVFCLFNTSFDSIENISLFALAAALILYSNSARSTAPAELEPAENATAGARQFYTPPA